MNGVVSVASLAVAMMVERLLDEGPIGMAAAARLLGTFRDGKACHPSTPTRWAISGTELPDGRVLKLESARLNGRLITSKAALVRFIAAQQSDAPVEPSPFRGPAARSKASAEAEQKLVAMGC